MPFAGFPPEAFSFYAGLEADNSRSYWQAHKDTYEDAVREPMEELLQELGREFGTSKIFRPYRNLRFSKDKTPYKTAQGAVVTSDSEEFPSRYVEVSSTGVRIGGGRFHMPKEELEKIRKAIDQPKTGNQLATIRAEVEQQGLTFHPPELKTAPRGYAKDHPRIELLRHKNHIAIKTIAPGKKVHSAALKTDVADTWRALTPLLTWLDRHATS